jgi:dihydrofolate synthase/folylpolyglutamate synthase
MDRSSAILERLLNLHPREIDLSLDRVEGLMADLGHPERRLPPVIHVAGTNGKGSTTAFMRAMLEAAGKRVHVYTSPHLVRFHERIRLATPTGSRFVDDDELADTLIEVEKTNDGRPITQFEITTAAPDNLPVPAEPATA